MKSESLLTVGMPVHNGERWIEEAVHAILSQGFHDFELVISDNASFDGTESICQGLARADARVRYHRQPRNLGVFRNYDFVFAQCQTKYFKWASSSDLCQQGFFESCVAVLEARDEVVVAYPQTVVFSSQTGASARYYDNLDLEQDRPSERLRWFNDWIALNNVMNGVIRTSVLAKVLPTKPIRGFDINLMAELALHGKFVEIPKPLFYRRFEPETTGEHLDGAQKLRFFAGAAARFGRKERLQRALDRWAMPLRVPIGNVERVRIWYAELLRSTWVVSAVLRKLVRLVR